MPPDHTLKFDYRLIVDMVKGHMKVDKVLGVSMLCSTPGWGDMLAKLPQGTSAFVLGTLDNISRLLPCMSDVIVVRGSPR